MSDPNMTVNLVLFGLLIFIAVGAIMVELYNNLGGKIKRLHTRCAILENQMEIFKNEVRDKQKQLDEWKSKIELDIASLKDDVTSIQRFDEETHDALLQTSLSIKELDEIAALRPMDIHTEENTSKPTEAAEDGKECKLEPFCDDDCVGCRDGCDGCCNDCDKEECERYIEGTYSWVLLNNPSDPPRYYLFADKYMVIGKLKDDDDGKVSFAIVTNNNPGYFKWINEDGQEFEKVYAYCQMPSPSDVMNEVVDIALKDGNNSCIL